jgi:translation initiation factor IF-3
VIRHRINEQIRVPIVQVVTQDGELHPFCAPAEALALARQSNLDLVEVGPHAQPPVCRIMDYGKFVYEQKKKRRSWP